MFLSVASKSPTNVSLLFIYLAFGLTNAFPLKKMRERFLTSLNRCCFLHVRVLFKTNGVIFILSAKLVLSKVLEEACRIT